MNILRVRCRNLEEFEEHYLPDLPNGGAFCPDDDRAGRRHGGGGRDGVRRAAEQGLIRGTVTAWRPALPRMRIRAGATVAFDAEEVGQARLHGADAAGQPPPTRRRKHTRIPIGIPAQRAHRLRAGVHRRRAARDQRQRRAALRGVAAADRHRRRPGDHAARQRGLVRSVGRVVYHAGRASRPVCASSTAKGAARAACASWSAASRRSEPVPLHRKPRIQEPDHEVRRPPRAVPSC